MADNFGALLQELRSTFEEGRTKGLEWRLDQLAKLREALLSHEGHMVEAMVSDLGRPKAETVMGELTTIVGEIDYLASHLRQWVKPERIWQPLVQRPSWSKVQRLPKGVVLIISPWNFPFFCSLIPIAAALSAGNCVVLKPSELAPQSCGVLQKILACLDQGAVRVVQGAVDETTELLKHQFDHIMFTGSGAVAKVVTRAAAEHLTPVTLELGGKSPVIIDGTAKLGTLGRRLCWGKFMNAGQTCVAPDYVLVVESVKDKVVAALQDAIEEFYGLDPHKSSSFGRIVSERHWGRIQGLLQGHGGNSWTPSGCTPASRFECFVPPTLVVDPSPNSKLMREEIFGPVLPIITVKSVEEAINFVNARDRPLALYMFSESRKTVDRVLALTASGGACINDCIYHVTNPRLPFGGAGSSGHGAYHGRAGFEEFSHKRAVMWRHTHLDIKLRYPPYTEMKVTLVHRLLIWPVFPAQVKAAIAVLLTMLVAGIVAVFLFCERRLLF